MGIGWLVITPPAVAGKRFMARAFSDHTETILLPIGEAIQR
jgi:hypothetical protein